jgi:peptidoglycan/xylan/chitin deacetylase (PgdA/CDA1 family)
MAAQHLAHRIKVVVSHVLYYLGILHLLQRIRLRRRAVVLMYHRVLVADEQRKTGSHPALVVDRETFADQMALLKKRFHVLSIEEFADRLTRRVPFPPSSCLITFDDGWKDNFTHAFPILKAAELPAVIFLPVNFIGRHRLFAREALTHLLVQAVSIAAKNPARASELRALLRTCGLEHVLDLPASSDPRPGVVEFLSAYRFLSTPTIEPVVEKLSVLLNAGDELRDDTDTFIDWEQVQKMAREGVSFGGHGVEHKVLTQVAPPVAEFEIAESKRVMDAKSQSSPLTFSYPGGGWNPELAAVVKASGYALAFTTDTGHVACTDDPFTLRRLNIHEDVTDSAPMFMARLVGLF